VSKRLQSELMALMTAGDPSVSAFPDGDSLFSWVGTITGAAGTAYAGMRFKMSLKFPAVSRAPSPAGNGAIYWKPRRPAKGGNNKKKERPWPRSSGFRGSLHSACPHFYWHVACSWQVC